jgi:hypothetical protein
LSNFPRLVPLCVSDAARHAGYGAGSTFVALEEKAKVKGNRLLEKYRATCESKGVRSAQIFARGDPGKELVEVKIPKRKSSLEMNRTDSASVSVSVCVSLAFDKDGLAVVFMRRWLRLTIAW